MTDDSPDDSLGALVRNMGDSRIRYRRNSPALGVARNHWVGFREAKGKYITILNHDDRLEPSFLARLVPTLEADEGVALAFCDHWVINSDGTRLEGESVRTSASWGRDTLRPGLHRPFSDLLVKQSIPMAMGTVFRRGLLPSTFVDHAGPAYDLWLTYWLCRTGFGVHFEPMRLSEWRSHAGNLTSKAGFDWAIGAATCWHAIATDPALRSVQSEARAREAVAYCSCAGNARRSGARLDSAQFALRSFVTDPTWRAAAACALSVLPSRAESLWRAVTE